MQPRNWILLRLVWAILYKECICEFRTRYTISALIMFALVTLSSISMNVAGAGLSPGITASLLWVIIFFCAMAGLGKTLIQEQEAGTLFTLHLYARGMAVFIGKLLYNVLLLDCIVVLVLPLFIIFLDLEIHLWLELVTTLFLGIIGMAAVATITALMVTGSQARGSLFTVINFPILLPQFLTAIATTTQILSDNIPDWQEFFFLAGYDISIITVALLLFDYLWYD